MTANKNVYFQTTDENFYKEIYPFFMDLKNASNLPIKKSDEIFLKDSIKGPNIHDISFISIFLSLLY